MAWIISLEDNYSKRQWNSRRRPTTFENYFLVVYGFSASSPESIVKKTLVIIILVYQ
jgi:hypothetical protein